MSIIIEYPLDRVEFHEKPNGIRISVRFYADKGKLKDLVKFCAGKKWDERDWDWMLERFKRSKAKNPKYKVYQGEILHIYPREEYIETYHVGLHYICQHSFDIFDYCEHREVKNWYYDVFDKNEIGYLYTKKGEKLLVRSDDIDNGFMLGREQCDEFGDSFTKWIKYRNTVKDGRYRRRDSN